MVSLCRCLSRMLCWRGANLSHLVTVTPNKTESLTSQVCRRLLIMDRPRS